MMDNNNDAIDNMTTGTRSPGTWRSDSSGASSTASRYNLDEEDTTPILAYIYGGDISTTSQKDLCELLDHDSPRRQRVTKKEIPRFASSLEVKRHDLYLPAERSEYSKYPNYDSSLASIRLPSNVYWGRMLFGQYDSLFIVSPETTPESSEGGESAVGSSFGDASLASIGEGEAPVGTRSS